MRQEGVERRRHAAVLGGGREGEVGPAATPRPPPQDDDSEEGHHREDPPWPGLLLDCAHGSDGRSEPTETHRLWAASSTPWGG